MEVMPLVARILSKPSRRFLLNSESLAVAPASRICTAVVHHFVLMPHFIGISSLLLEHLLEKYDLIPMINVNLSMILSSFDDL